MLAHEISTILFRKVQDPRVRGVHVVSVSVSNDYSSAHVFFSTLDETTDLEVVQQGLDSAKAFVRLELRKVIKMKTVPEVFFTFDPSVRRGDRILELLKKLDSDKKEPSID